MLRSLEGRGWRADVLTVVPADPREVDVVRLENLPNSTAVWGLPAEALADPLLARVVALVRTLRGSPGQDLAESATSFGTPGDSGGGASSQGAPRSVSSRRQAIRLAIYQRGQRIAARAMARACVGVSKGDYDLIVSSGPPHSAHLAAMSVATRVRTPWVMDWRDPWTFDEFPDDFDPAKFARAEARKEARCVHAAALIVANTTPVARRLAQLYPDAAARVLAIPNGADGEPVLQWGRSERMRIVYAGSLFQGRDPRLFMAAMKLLHERHGVAPESVVLQIVTGQDEYGGRSLADWAVHFGVGSMFERHALMPRHKLFEWLAGSAVNLLVQVPSTYQVPAKLFEGVQLPAWLLAITNPPNAISDILDGSSAIVVPPDPDRIAAELALLHTRWSRGEQPQPVNLDRRFDRGRQAERMHEALLSVLQATRSTE